MGFKSTFHQNVLPIFKMPLACLFASTEDVVFVRTVNSADDSTRYHWSKCLFEQTQMEIIALKQAVKRAGYQLSEIARTEVILSKSVEDDQLAELYELLESLPGEVEIHYEEPGLFTGKSELAPSQLIAIEAMVIH